MKKPLMFVLLLLTLVSFQVSAYDFVVDGICYTILESDGVPAVAVDQRYALGGDYSGSVNIPPTVTYGGTNYTVTEIAELAFFDCHDLTSVTIPNSVTKIGCEAFTGTGLTSIYIPESVVDIYNNENVFGSELKSITVAAGNPVYDSRNNCNAIIYTEDNILITGCVNTVIPNDVGSIWYCAFQGITDLLSIVLPSSVSEVAPYAFNNCTTLSNVSMTEGLAWICNYAFNGCSSLKSINFPSTLKSIGEAAFQSTDLKSIHIPKKVYSIGKSAFAACHELNSITVDPANTTYDSRNNCNAIIKSSNNTLIVGCANSTIPSSVTEIGDEAFNETEITAVSIPSTVTAIGKKAFQNCTQLQSVTLPNSITEIEQSTFNGCTSLLACNIPNSVTKIGANAYSNCSSLKSITIPQSVNSISTNPFSGCSGLISIAVEDGNSIYDSHDNCNAIIETACMKLISGCSTTIIPDDVKVIGSSAFNGISSLKAIVIPDSVTSILTNAFRSSGLTNIMIPGNVSTFQSYCFEGCKNLSSVVISAGVTTIGSSAFRNCPSLSSVYLSETVTTIGNSCFFNNKNDTLLTSVSVANPNPVAITEYTFSNRARATLHVPEASIAAYQAADVWKEFKFITKLQDSSALGDVNGDGMVNADDCDAIADFLTGKSTEGFSIRAADVNGDGKIDVADYTAVSHLIQYGTITKP